MDENRFDRLSRSLTTTTPRRALLGLLLGAGSGLVAGRAGAATCRLGGVACGSNGQCCSGRCLGNRTCACSKSVSCKNRLTPASGPHATSQLDAVLPGTGRVPATTRASVGQERAANLKRGPSPAQLA